MGSRNSESVHLQELLLRLQTHPLLVSNPGIAGLTLFVLVAAFSQPLLLPITPFAMTAGFLFGFWKALWVMLAAKMLAASINFALTRSFAKSPALWLTRRFPLFYHLNASIEKEGLRFAILLRLCPFPFAVASYGYGMTRLRFRHYLIATFVGILAPTVLFTALGASARSGLESLNSSASPKSSWETWLFLVGLVASFFVTRRIARIARHKVTENAGHAGHTPEK